MFEFYEISSRGGYIKFILYKCSYPHYFVDKCMNKFLASVLSSKLAINTMPKKVWWQHYYILMKYCTRIYNLHKDKLYNEKNFGFKCGGCIATYCGKLRVILKSKCANIKKFLSLLERELKGSDPAVKEHQSLMWFWRFLRISK